MGAGFGLQEVVLIAMMLVMGLGPWIAVIAVGVAMWRRIGGLEARVAQLEAGGGQGVTAMPSGR